MSFSVCFVNFFCLASYSCQVISGSINGVKTGSFVVLVMLKTAYTETFHVLQFESKYLKVKITFDTCNIGAVLRGNIPEASSCSLAYNNFK